MNFKISFFLIPQFENYDFENEDNNTIPITITDMPISDIQNKNQGKGGEGFNFKNQNDRDCMMNSKRRPESSSG